MFFDGRKDFFDAVKNFIRIILILGGDGAADTNGTYAGLDRFQQRYEEVSMSDEILAVQDNDLVYANWYNELTGPQQILFREKTMP